MARIAVAGFQHETNTFAPVQADFAAFLQADGWPPLVQGGALLEAVKGMNLPAAGAVDALRQDGHELVPLLWCSATPSGAVTEDAFERVAAMLLDQLAAALPLDGVYLDLHGAMVAEHREDGEGELLQRIRALVGPALPVVASLDLHANVTAAMVRHADLLDAYRTYPHLDMAETGARAARRLGELIAGRSRPVGALRKLPFLVPLNWGCTMFDPARAVYAWLGECADSHRDACLSVAMGFPLADIHDCGPAVLAYAPDAAAADRLAALMAGYIVEREADFAGEILDPDRAVREAMALAATATRPVVLADTQDNPGGGGTCDTVGVLEALVRHGAQRAVVASIHDPEAAAAAHAAGEGADIALEIGGKAMPGQRPFVGRFRVARLGAGRFTGTGPMWGGAAIDLGPMARLELLPDRGVAVIVATRKLQAADQSILRHLGIDPAAQAILALKSSVHFRADFAPIAERILLVAAPGACVADPATLPWTRLRDGVRLKPLGPVFRRAA